jgi:hypothetical protein
MTGCHSCGGFGGHHDPTVHDEGRTRYESHIWSPRTDDEDDDCLACGVTWGACEDECPGITTDPH